MKQGRLNWIAKMLEHPAASVCPQCGGTRLTRLGTKDRRGSTLLAEPPARRSYANIISVRVVFSASVERPVSHEKWR